MVGSIHIRKEELHHCRVVAKKFVCRLAYKLSRLKKARSAFCRRRSRRGGRYGRGLPPPIGGYGGPPPGNFENFNSIWCTLVKSKGSFMQKETTIKEKTLFQLLCGIDTQGSQEFIQPFHLEYMILNRSIASA